MSLLEEYWKILNLAVQYGITIRILLYANRKFGGCTCNIDRQTAFNSPPNFPAIRYYTCVEHWNLSTLYQFHTRTNLVPKSQKNIPANNSPYIAHVQYTCAPIPCISMMF